MELPTSEQVDALLSNNSFLEKLKSRAGTPHECAKTHPEAQAREVMEALVAVDNGKQRGLGYRWRRTRLAGAIIAYLSTNGETVSTYLPEGS